MKQLIQTTILLLALLLPALATAYDFEVDGIYYNINGNEAAVTHHRHPGFIYIGYSGSVVIPATVTYNGTTYPVTSIDTIAFYGSTKLTSIEIPNSVTAIGQQAFGYCPGLASIVVESGNPRFDSRNNCNAIIETAINTLIAGCKNTTIPNSVTEIGDFAFYNCDSLTSIVIPNSVTSIGQCAFYGCTGLTSIVIPNSVTAIGHFAFAWCTGLTSIDIPNSVTEIGVGVFDDCTELTSIVVESGNPRYDSRNNCNAIIETADNTLIYGCKNTTIPNSVTIIGDAFFGCTGLTSIDIPNSVTEIYDYAFYNCRQLTDVYCYIADLSRVSSGEEQFCLNNGDYSGRTLHVLQGTADAYRADENWYPYFGQIVEDIFIGDVNRDLEVNIADVNAVIDMILGGNASSAADVNGDGEINIADVNALINIVLSGS